MFFPDKTIALFISSISKTLKVHETIIIMQMLKISLFDNNPKISAVVILGLEFVKVVLGLRIWRRKRKRKGKN